MKVFIRLEISCPSIGPMYVKPSSSKTAPTLGTAKRLTLPFIFFNSSGISLPIRGIFLTLSWTLSDKNCNGGLNLTLFKYVERAPTGGDIDISLSFRTTTKGVFGKCPA